MRPKPAVRIAPERHPAWRLAPALALLVVALALPAGATEVTFRFRPPQGARTVTVAGSFNDWSTAAAPMADVDRDGLWQVTLDLEPGDHQYKYVVNGSDWHTDETAAEFAPDGFGGRNSVVTVGAEPMSVGDEAPDAAAEPEGTPVTFRFRPPERQVNAVSVAGTFNAWDAAAHPMVDADGDGLWQVTLRLAPGRHAYQFVVDGIRWHTDDFAAEREPDGFGGWDALLEVGSEPLTVGSRDWRRRKPR